ncbi:MAG: TetR/AcrR family transcriptional regulator [Pseudomonadota bacterium]
MPKRALTPTDWLNLALQELKTHGYAALRAQPLAKKLGVSRGSFYHHFESLEAFQTAVIAHWSETTSGQIILDAQAAGDPVLALDDLLRTTLRSGEALERAVRSWSTVAPGVAEAVDRVDRTRIGVAERLLTDAGVPKTVATARAKVLYWAAIGRLMLPFPQSNVLTDADISDLTALVTRH